MTRDDIIKLAREAGFVEEFEECANSVWVQDTEITEYIERFAALVAAAEREACAQVAMRVAVNGIETSAAIRAMGQDPMPLFDDWNKDWK